VGLLRSIVGNHVKTGRSSFCTLRDRGFAMFRQPIPQRSRASLQPPWLAASHLFC
jgi:hypothetical protein